MSTQRPAKSEVGRLEDYMTHTGYRPSVNLPVSITQHSAVLCWDHQTPGTMLGYCMLQVAVMYFRVFLKTMQREWFGIDRLRLDKFMLLIRCFLAQASLRLCTLNW